MKTHTHTHPGPPVVCSALDWENRFCFKIQFVFSERWVKKKIRDFSKKDTKDGGLLKPQMSGHNGRHPDKSYFRYHNSSAVGHVVSKVTSLVKLLSATICVLGAEAVRDGWFSEKV